MSRRLEMKRKELEDELSEQLSEVSEKAIDVGKQALVIAGGVFVAYQLVKLFTGSGKKKKNKKAKKQVYQKVLSEGQDPSGAETIIIKEVEAKQSNVFWEELKSEFGAMLLGLVKAKIYEALEKFNENMQAERDEQEK